MLCWSKARPIKGTGSQNAPQKSAACVSYQTVLNTSLNVNPITGSLLFVQTKAAMFKACLSLILINSLGKCVREIQIRTCHASVKDVCECVCARKGGHICAQACL